MLLEIDERTESQNINENQEREKIGTRQTLTLTQTVENSWKKQNG
jgi:hypothetical protein